VTRENAERRLCEEVHSNLAYRWFCRLDLEGEVPDHSTFPKGRHGRFRASDLLRYVFEKVVSCRIAEGLVGGEDFPAKLMPEDPALYRHTAEGPDDMPAHIKAALTQTHLGIPLQDGRLARGTRQGVYLFEHRHAAHRREIALHLIGE